MHLIVNIPFFMSINNENYKGEMNCMCSAKPRSRKRKNLAEHEKQVNIQFLELDSPGLPTDDANGEFAAKDDGNNFFLKPL